MTSEKKGQVFLVELNEINFDFVRRYCDMGRLPNFSVLLRRFPVHRTTSEQDFDLLEPWIQWVTAHTGMSYSQHKVFRLGDIVHTSHRQIWEDLADAGLRVGAVSPMNAVNRLRDPAFFVPDPWTRTGVLGPGIAQRVHAAVSHLVNENATGETRWTHFWWLGLGLMRYASVRNYARYLKLVLGSLVSAPWRRALVLDLLLTDIFLAETRRTRANFASLFLNAGAHIQHHYMFSSRAYAGELRNPSWYLSAEHDPVYEVLETYDAILSVIMSAHPEARIVVATGLHQVPHVKGTFYWRLRNHADFLRRIGVVFNEVQPLMSRDFVVKCTSAADAKAAEHRLLAVHASDGSPMFSVDNRGNDLFVMLVYAGEIRAPFPFRVEGREFEDLAGDVAFVALKNGEHDGVGYLIDTADEGLEPLTMPLAELPQRIKRAFSLVA